MLKEVAVNISQAALRTGSASIASEAPAAGVFDSPPVYLLAQPNTQWAQDVDLIEAPFAEDYVKEEYEKNGALAKMGFLELRNMLKTYGVPSGQQTNYDTLPLANREYLVVGTGPGREPVAIAALGGNVTGFDATKQYVDITAENIRRAQNQLGRPLSVQLSQCPAESFPYPDNYYDGVSSLFGVMNHVEEWEPTVMKIADALKEGGVLNLSMYGPEDALIFRLQREGAIAYQPSILQRRGPGGIYLGSSSKILPANFPSPETISDVLQTAGLQIEQTMGYLRTAALFPRNPSEENIQAYQALLQQVDRNAYHAIANSTDPDEMLLRAMLYDKRNQGDINDFAYVGFVARKETR